MKALPCLALLSSLLVTTAALADDVASPVTPAQPTPPQRAEMVVRQQLLRPLEEREQKRSSFSRAAVPPAERRVRILDAVAVADAKAGEFHRFAIDDRFGRRPDSPWIENKIVGCVYPARGEVFVKRGDTWHPAGMLLGKRVAPAPAEICQAATGPAVPDRT